MPQKANHARELPPASLIMHFVLRADPRRMSLWNLLTKSKTKQFTVSAQPQPLTAVTFSADGAWLAYAASYDWSRGVAGHESNSPTISLHQVSCPNPEAVTQCMVMRPVCFGTCACGCVAMASGAQQ